MPYIQRRSEVEMYRRAELLRLQKNGDTKLLKQTRKNYDQTQYYIHLTFQERRNFVFEIAQMIGNWGFARLFAECIDKIFFDPKRSFSPLDEQAFEQVISRFEQFLKKLNANQKQPKNYGLLIHDNNQTIEKRHTELMRRFHQKGTFWTYVNNIIETPLFVDSSLTSMIQMADVCAYAIRRYLENNETVLFNEILKRGDRKNAKTVGVRHFTNPNCSCLICQLHKNVAPANS